MGELLRLTKLEDDNEDVDDEDNESGSTLESLTPIVVSILVLTSKQKKIIKLSDRSK